MSLIDFYGNTAGDNALVWPGSVASGFAHRSGSAYGTPWACPNSAAFSKMVNGGTHINHLFMGIAVQANSWSQSSIGLFSDGGVTQHLNVAITPSGVELRRGGTGGTVIASYTFAPAANAAYYVEIEAVISDTVGICNVRLNGSQVITYSGDTRNGGTTAGINLLWFSQAGNLGTSWSDFYLLDDAGSAPLNTFLGDVRIPKCRPSAAGASTQFTPDSGANYARVNENPYSAANYVQSSTSGHTDSYAMDDMPASVGTVLAVKASVIAKNPDGGTAQIKNLVRVASTNYLGTAVTLGASDAIVSTTWGTNPNTGVAWTKSDVNAMESGFQRV